MSDTDTSPEAVERLCKAIDIISKMTWAESDYLAKVKEQWPTVCGISWEDLPKLVSALKTERDTYKARAAPKVKPLVWEIFRDGYRALSCIGEYKARKEVNPTGSKHFVYNFGQYNNFTQIGYFETLEAAKAAAQADYERRILEALE